MHNVPSWLTGRRPREREHTNIHFQPKLPFLTGPTQNRNQLAMTLVRVSLLPQDRIQDLLNYLHATKKPQNHYHFTHLSHCLVSSIWDISCEIFLFFFEIVTLVVSSLVLTANAFLLATTHTENRYTKPANTAAPLFLPKIRRIRGLAGHWAPIPHPSKSCDKVGRGRT